jgi:hypothetical protein
MFRSLSLSFAMLVCTSILFASPANRGYSGAPGSLGRCASSCHGTTGGTVQITGFPTQYVPDSTYLVTIAALSGSPIKNFNGSVRTGTSATNAGVLSAGTGTATYNVSQETNGIRLSSLDQKQAQRLIGARLKREPVRLECTLPHIKEIAIRGRTRTSL